MKCDLFPLIAESGCRVGKPQRSESIRVALNYGVRLRTRRLLLAGTLIRMSGAGGCQNESFSETLKVQCGEDGMGRRNSGPIAYRATSGRLVKREIGKRRRWRLRYGLTRSRKVGVGSWPRGGKQR